MRLPSEKSNSARLRPFKRSSSTGFRFAIEFPQPGAGLPPEVAATFAVVCAFLLSGCAQLESGKEQPAKAKAPAQTSTPSYRPTPPPAKLGPMQFTKGEATSLFDGKTLTGWIVTDFAGTGEVRVEDGKLILAQGYMTGVTWTNEAPSVDYEIDLEAMRVDGSDFFCGLTFPVKEASCSLIVGGWGGGVVGLSSLDGQDASNNETTHYLSFETGRWYAIRVRVGAAHIEAWIDSEKVADVDTTGKQIGVRIEMESSKPLGIATWSTTGALRNIRLRPF
jgi:hypothetical protein